MFSFLKKKSNYPNVPTWASFFDGVEYSTFIREIDNFFRSKGIDYETGDGLVTVKTDELGSHKLGLVNVAQVCKPENRKNYQLIISSHFNALLEAKQFEREFEKIVDNFEEVKKYIGVRLYDNQYVASVGKENTLGKDLAGDIYAMIVFDFPSAIQSIKPEAARPWNKSLDELFEIGKANIKAKYPFQISKEKFGEFDIWLVQSAHFFSGNIVFDLESRNGLVGSKGSLIGLPHRHAAIIYPIESLEVLKAVNALIPTIYGMNQEGPGSLSNNLLLYKDKTLTNLPYKIEEKKVQFFPPDELIALLEELK